MNLIDLLLGGNGAHPDSIKWGPLLLKPLALPPPDFPMFVHYFKEFFLFICTNKVVVLYVFVNFAVLCFIRISFLVRDSYWLFVQASSSPSQE